MLTILEKADLLQGAEFFCEVRTQSLARVAAIAQEVRFETHQRLYAQDEAADAMFVVLEGEVTFSIGIGTESGRRGALQSAGALALFANRPQGETATATRPVRALRIEQQDLFEAMAEDFGITRGMLCSLAGLAAGNADPSLPHGNFRPDSGSATQL
jgi:CRP-like cAMP-binding protein